MGIIDWLALISGMIAIVAIVVLAIIGGWYLYSRKRLLRTAKESENIEKPDKPEIVVSLRPYSASVQCLMLCIENLGSGTAYDVRFRTGASGTAPFITPASNLSDVSLFKKNNFLQKGIGCFGPGQKIKQFLISLTEGLPEELKQPFQISVTYTDSLSYTHENRYTLDFSDFESLGKINSIEGKMTSDSNRLPQETAEPKGNETLPQEAKEPVQSEENKTLSPDLQKLVTMYNTGKDAELQKIYNPRYSIRVTNETELYQNPNVAPVFKTMANGSFVAYAIDSENVYAVVPFSGLVLQNTLYSSGAFGKVFECPGFDSEHTYHVKVIRPAFFKQDPVNEKWTLEEKGKLELKEKDY